MFKTVSLTLAAIAASATIASAAGINDLSNFSMEQDRGNQVELGLVRATSDGVVEIYTYHQDEIGTLLGSTEVHEGANSNVDVQIPRTLVDAIAVLKVNGQTVDTQEIHFN